MRSRPTTALAALAVALCCGTAPARAAEAVSQPLSLDAALTLALQRNPTFLSAHQDVAIAVAALRESEGPQAPRVTLSDNLLYATPVAQLNTPFGSLPFAGTTLTNVPVVNVSYTVFDGGVTAARISRAAADLAAANAREQAARATLLDQTAAAYYQLTAAIASSAVAARALDVAQRHQQDAEAFLRAGQVPRADLLRAQTEVADDRMQQIRADGAVTVAQIALDRAMNVPLDRRYTPTERLDVPAAAPSLETLLAAARARRPELGAARAAVDAATFALREARGGNAPHADVFAADGNVQPAVIPGYRNQFSTGLSLVWTLFDHGVTAARIDAAKAGIAKAKLALEAAEADVEQQVRDAFAALDEARAGEEAARRFVELAQENLRLAQVRYRGGVGTISEVRDAELNATSAQRSLDAALVAKNQNLVHLRFSAGLL